MNEQILLQRMHLKGRYKNLTPELVVKTASISTALALILTIPSLLAFVGIYYSTGNIILGALGFSLHFVGIGFAHRISMSLETLFN